jgi:DNA polymerase-3 subunit delta'
MSAPEPRANPLLIGHDAAERTLREAATGGRLHHAWLIAGPEGVGKATLAFRFARWLLAGAPAGAGQGLALPAEHPVFRRVASGAHADLVTVARAWDPSRRRLRSQIAVDDIRRISAFMALTPAEGGWRVAIVDGAEDMNANSANALLKVLEEPPRRAILLLVCSAPGRLLPTIRSRCRRLRLNPLAEADMTRLLATFLPDTDPDERLRLAALAEGAPGRALLLAEAEGLAIAALVDRVLAALPSPPPGLGHELADALARNEGGFAIFMDLLRTTLAAATRAAAAGRADPDQARLAAMMPLAACSELWHALGVLADETERFALDKRQALLQAMSLMERAGRKGMAETA